MTPIESSTVQIPRSFTTPAASPYKRIPTAAAKTVSAEATTGTFDVSSPYAKPVIYTV